MMPNLLGLFVSILTQNIYPFLKNLISNVAVTRLDFLIGKVISIVYEEKVI